MPKVPRYQALEINYQGEEGVEIYHPYLCVFVAW
jgi:hypothetical protein